MNQRLFTWSAVMIGAGLTACGSNNVPEAQDSAVSPEAGKHVDGAAKDSGGSPEGGPVSDAGDSGTTAGLQWYTSCGYPICPGPVDAGPDADSVDASVVCEAVGSTCTLKGQTCGTPSVANCGVVLVCDDHDPKGPSEGLCPISSRMFKDDIKYMGDAELEALHDEALRMKLATYNYKGQVADPGPKHLGFIIEDDPHSLAVDETHNRVDLYGYVSMVVASMQVQEKEIAELKRELEVTRREALSCRGKRK
jgi:hypothetical protein